MSSKRRGLVKTDGFNESSLIKDSTRKKESILSLRIHGAIEVWISFKLAHTYLSHGLFLFVCKRTNQGGNLSFTEVALTLHYNGFWLSIALLRSGRSDLFTTD